MPMAASVSSAAYYYPNKMARIMLMALEDTIGRSGMNAVLKLARAEGGLTDRLPPNNMERQVSFVHMGAMMASLDDLYGPRGGHGLALRAGRASFQYALREFGPLIGVGDLAFRLLPMPAKMIAGAEVFCDTFNRYSDQQVRLAQTEQHLIWEIVRCPLCWGRQTDTACCYLAVGILQEALHWVSGGRNFHLRETTCIARGDASCTILIDKTPLD